MLMFNAEKSMVRYEPISYRTSLIFLLKRTDVVFSQYLKVYVIIIFAHTTYCACENSIIPIYVHVFSAGKFE
jgi:hypothetical protein